MTKKITKAQEAEMKREHELAKSKRKVMVTRSFYFLLAGGNIAIAVFLGILNSDVQTGHLVLTGFSVASALFFTAKLIGE